MKSLVFNNTEIPVVVNKDGVPYVSVRHVCETLGVSPQKQHLKLSKSPEFMCHHMVMHDTSGRVQELFCIRADQAHLWVAGISAAKISNPERQKAFITYKHECANVLYQHFLQKGEDMFGIAQELRDFRAEINAKMDGLMGVADTVFGDEKEVIQNLVKQVAEMHGVDGRTVWGWIQTEIDVASYKKQNMRVINFLRNKLGKGITLVKE
jgi:hypothetical protein